MADITITAVYGSVVEDEGQLFIGFAEGEDEEEAYVLFRQPLAGGPVWFEVNDENFGAEDAILAISAAANGLEITLKPALAAKFGWATSVMVRFDPAIEDADEAVSALAKMLNPVWQTQ